MLKNDKAYNKNVSSSNDDWSEKKSNNSFNSFKTDGESNNLNELNNEIKEKNEVIDKDTVSEPSEINSWDELDIDATLLRGIYSAGFEKPSPVQRKAIKPIIEGKDIIAQAQSGTGKTATFSIGALSKVDTSLNTVQILILAPTRELSKQHSEVIAQLGSAMSGLKIARPVRCPDSRKSNGKLPIEFFYLVPRKNKFKFIWQSRKKFLSLYYNQNIRQW